MKIIQINKKRIKKTTIKKQEERIFKYKQKNNAIKNNNYEKNYEKKDKVEKRKITIITISIKIIIILIKRK